MNAPDNQLAAKQGAADIQTAREDLAAALRWSAHLGLYEGVCNHYSYE
ncbi:MAG: hypothetical protein RL109_1962, partial [Pseudomonadota bacterium]